MAFSILTQVEVQDAMNFAIASGGDPRFRSIVNVLRDNQIWKFWFARDLKIVQDVLDGRKEIWSIIPEAPEWKTYYLWWRLVISAVQYEVLEIPETLTVYPEGSQVRFIRLNELELRIENGEVLFLDFRREYPRYLTAQKFYKPFYGPPTYDVQWFADFYWSLKHVERFLTFKYPSFNKHAIEKYVNLIRSLYGFFTNEYARFDDKSDELKGPPRLITATKLLVASRCISCNAEAKYRESGAHTHNLFCGKSCQRRFHY